jgi:hypothetical protein
VKNSGVRRKLFIKIVLIFIFVSLFYMLVCYVSKLSPFISDPPQRMFRFSLPCDEVNTEQGPKWRISLRHHLVVDLVTLSEGYNLNSAPLNQLFYNHSVI